MKYQRIMQVTLVIFNQLTNFAQNYNLTAFEI
jgi:hypothetical protein